MLKPYQYIFWKIYGMFRGWIIKYPKTTFHDSPMVTAFRVVMLMLIFAGGPIFGILRLLSVNNYIPFEQPTWFPLVLLMVLFSIHYLLFMHKQKYLKIQEKFQKESKFKSIIGWFLIGLFFSSCLVIFVIIMRIPVPK